jgi:hypothetical protein
VLNRDLTLTAASGEDVLLSEGRIVSETGEAWDPPARPFPGGSFDPRTAIFRAREAYREKNRANAMAARLAAEAGAGAFVSGPSDEFRVEALGGGMAGDSSGEEMTPVEGVGIHGSDVDSTATAEAADVGRWLATDSERVVEGGLDSESALRELELGPKGAVQRTTAPLQPEVCEPEYPAQVAEALRGDDVQQSLVSSDLPAWFRADLPRVCRACRDFRPGTDGQRGWCANAWAFTHRQLVREDDAAPCHSAIGDWWVPVDDVWLVAADVSAHGRPTPLLDRTIGDEGERRRRS